MNIGKMNRILKDGGTDALNEYLITQSYKSAKKEGLVKGLVIGGCLGAILAATYIKEHEIVIENSEYHKEL